jgi:hypothetical protein
VEPRFPVIVGLTLCEDVVSDPATRHVSLIRCFTGRGVESFPTTSPPFCVFATLLDGTGDFDLQLSVDYLGPEPMLPEFNLVYSVRGPLRVTDPLQPVRVNLRLSVCPLPYAGVYQFTLALNGEWLAQASMHVYIAETES